MLKISFAGCLGLSPVISTQFTFEMRVAASNREKNSLKTPIWGFKVIHVGTPWKLVSSACYDVQQQNRTPDKSELKAAVILKTEPNFKKKHFHNPTPVNSFTRRSEELPKR